MAPLPPPHRSEVPTARIFLGIGFFVTLFIGVFALLESNWSLAIVIGFASLICLILLFSPIGQAPRD